MGLWFDLAPVDAWGARLRWFSAFLGRKQVDPDGAARSYQLAVIQTARARRSMTTAPGDDGGRVDRMSEQAGAVPDRYMCSAFFAVPLWHVDSP